MTLCSVLSVYTNSETAVAGPYWVMLFSTRIIVVCPAACGPRITCGVITITSVA